MWDKLQMKALDIIFRVGNWKTRKKAIGKCPNCDRVIRYLDIEKWEAQQCFVGCTAPVYNKSGSCPSCGQNITARGMGSCLVGLPFEMYRWWIVDDKGKSTIN